MFLKKIIRKNFIHLLFVLYIFFALLLQILGIDAKGTLGDTVYKILVLSSFYLIFVTIALKNKSYSIKNIPVILVFMITQVITIFYNDYWEFTNISVLLYFILMLFLFMIFLKNYKTDIDGFIYFSKNFILLVFISSIYNIISNLSEILSISLSLSSYSYNFTSFFDSRNTFSYFLYIAIVLNIFIINKSKKIWFYLLTSLIMSLNLILTFSRSSIISLAIFVLLYFLLTTKFKGKVFIYLTIILTYFVFITNDSVHEIILYIFRPDVGLTGRTIIYEIGLEFFKSNNILFGSGYVKPIKFILETTGNVTFHNSYISLLTYGGVILISFYILLYSYIVLNLIRLIKINRYVGMFFLSFFISYIAYTMVEEQLIFFTSVSSFVITLILIFYPISLLNNLKEKV